MRALRVSRAGAETPLETFARDHVSVARVADAADVAEIRVWHAAESYVSLGRYHRMPAASPDLVRRLTGGRPVVVGPGVVCMTGVYPSLSWLAAGSTRIEPEQVLNRALRPLLASLRDAGVDAFYPGRDLVTVSGRPIVLASFTTLPDGVVVVTAALAESADFGATAEWIARADPAGVVTFDADAFGRSTSVAEALARSVEIDWAQHLAEHAGEAHACETSVAAEDAPLSLDVSAAFSAHQAERGPIAPGTAVAFGVEMLGAIEAAATLERGRILELTLAGDLIAPFETIEEIEVSLHGEPPTRAAADRALLAVLARPGRFVLGVRNLADIIARLT